MQENDLDPSLLYFAAKDGNVEEMEKLVKAGANVNIAHTKMPGIFPIDAAASNGHLDALKWLIKSGANITPNVVKSAFYARNIEMVDYLYKTNKTLFSDIGITDLHIAAFRDDVESVKSLVEAGQDINAYDQSGNSPLSLAASSTNRTQVIQYLIKNNLINLNDAPVKDSTYKGIALAWRFSADKKWEVLEELNNNKDVEPINLNAAPLGDHPNKGLTLAWLLIDQNQFNLLKKVVQKKGAKPVNLNINKAGEIDKGITMAFQLAVAEQWDLLRELAAMKGAKSVNLNAILLTEDHPDYGITVAWKLASLHQWDLLQELASQEGTEPLNLNVMPMKQKNFNKPYTISKMLNEDIVYATMKNKLITIEFMIEQGADIYSVNSFQHNALHGAAINPVAAVLEYFLAKDININAQNSNNETPIIMAAQIIQREVEAKPTDKEKIEAVGKNIRLLIAHDANRFIVYKKDQTVFDIQKKCPELVPYLENYLEVKLYKCIFFKDSESIIQNIFSNSYKSTGQIEINKKIFDIKDHLFALLNLILIHHNVSPFLQPRYRKKLIDIIKIFDNPSYEQNEDKFKIILSDNKIKKLENIFYHLAEIENMIITQKISHDTKETMNFDIKVKYVPHCNLMSEVGFFGQSSQPLTEQKNKPHENELNELKEIKPNV